MNFDGRSVIITGGAGEIGRACARAFLETGAKVAVCDVSIERATEAVDELRNSLPGSHLVALASDVRVQSECIEMVHAAATRLGSLDVGVNLAGIISPGPSIEVTDTDWERLIDVNLNGTFYCCQAFARVMSKSSKGGAIVNTASIAGSTAWPARASYGASKAAVENLTKSLAVEWVDLGIRVNAVAPGWVETTLLEPAIRKGYIDLEAIKRGIPMHRIADKREIADAILFLASERASYITGQTLAVDGGYLVGSPSIAIR